MWLVLAVAAFALAVIAHIALVHVTLSVSVVVRYLAVGLVVGGLLILTLLVLYGISGEAFAGAMIFAFLSELYIFLFTLVVSSVTVTLILHLRKGEMDEAAVSRIYDPEGMVTFRLEQMVRNGFATEQDGRYSLTPNGRFLVGWFVRLRTLFGHDRREAVQRASAAPPQR